MADEVRFEPVDLSFDDLANAQPSATAGGVDTPQKPLPAGALEYKKWLFERRLSYGVEFFKFHADQRMKMFQFFLVFVGLFAGAYATLLTKSYLFDSSLLALLAGVGTLGFLHLEHRNEELVHIAEDVLASLESDVLFAKYIRPIPWPRRRSWWGRMGAKPLTPRPVGIFRREAADIYGKFREQNKEEDAYRNCAGNTDESQGRSRHEHGKWLPWLEQGIFYLFAVLTVLPWFPAILGVLRSVSIRCR